MSDIELSLKGLSTDGSPHSQPDGALREAKNVVSRRENTLEPRPGFKVNSNAGLDGSYTARDQVVALIPFYGDILVISHDDAGGYYIAARSLTTQYFYNISDNTLPAWDDAAVMPHAESRGNLYLSTSAGVVKHPQSTSVLETAGYPGVCALHVPSAAGSGTAIATTKYVHYAATLERSDTGGSPVLQVGQPTGLYLFYNADSVTVDPTVRCFLPPEASAADTIRLYRSKAASSSSASGQLFATASAEVSSADVTAGYVDLVDALADTDLGASLYTNPEREGPARANHRPPKCKTMCEYQGSLLFGNITSPHRLAIRWPEGGDVTGSATGVGRRDGTGTITGGGSDQVTGVTTTGLEVGQLVDDDTGWTGTGPVRITDINGTTLTMSHTYAGGSTALGGHIYDAIRIKTATEDQYYPAAADKTVSFGNNGLGGLGMFLAGVVGGESRSGTVASAEVNAYSLTPVSIREVGQGEPETFVQSAAVIEALDLGSAGFDVFASHGDEYDPPLPALGETFGEDSVSDDWSDAIYVSKKQEPEHVPLGNFYRVGTLSSDLIRMVPTRDAVWCFKEDGLYSFSGYGERSGFRVDPVDLSLVLVSPRCAVELDGAVYAWTNRGVVRVSAGGLTDISSAFLEADLRAAQRAIGTNDTSTTGIFMSANTETHEVYLGITETSGADTADKIYCFNTKTGVWTTWEGGPMGSVACLTVSGSTMYMGDASGSFALYEERQSDVALDSSDFESALSGASIGAPTNDVYNITWSSATPSYTPLVGDVLEGDSGDLAVVVTVNSSTDVDAYTEATFSSEGDITAYTAFESCVAWTAKSARHPLFVKAFQEFALGFESLRGVYQWDAIFESTTGAAETTESQTESTYDTTTDSSEPRRTFVSRNHSMCAQLLPKLCIRQGTSKWRLVASALKYTPVSERLHA